MLHPEPKPMMDRPAAKRGWLPVALGSAVLLTLVTIAGIIMITRPASTVEQLLILTVPSGADVKFDSLELGRSPVKLEGVKIGSHHLLVTKDGFQPIDTPVAVSEARTLDYKLSPLPPKDSEGLSKEEANKKYEQQAEEAFSRGDYAIPYDGSALYFADMIDGPPGSEMRERVRNALLQSAQNAMSRGDLGQASEVFQALNTNFPEDEAARVAAARLESQIASHRGDIRDLLRKAEDALNTGRLIDPQGASAFYFSRQVLALDRQNTQARAIRTQVRDKLQASIDDDVERGDLEGAAKQLDRALRMFPDDKQIGTSLRDAQDRQTQLESKQNDPAFRRRRGLDNYSKGLYQDAIADLEYANEHKPGEVAVVFDLGRSYFKVGESEKALMFLRSVPQDAGDAYKSSLGIQGDIAVGQGKNNEALDFYAQARALGGSTLYGADDLTYKIDRLNRKATAKASEPSALMIQVKHLHGGILHGSCTGTLKVDSKGVRYDGQDSFSSSIMGTEVAISKGEMIVKFLGKQEKFKPLRPEMAERFREALVKFQTYNPQTGN